MGCELMSTISALLFSLPFLTRSGIICRCERTVGCAAVFFLCQHWQVSFITIGIQKEVRHQSLSNHREFLLPQQETGKRNTFNQQETRNRTDLVGQSSAARILIGRRAARINWRAESGYRNVASVNTIAAIKK